MRRLIGATLLLVLSTNTSLAQSNFLTTEEAMFMERARASMGQSQPTGVELFGKSNDLPSDEADRLTLRSLIYFAEDRWSFWLNEQQITPTQIPNNIRLEQINAEYVQLTYIQQSGRGVVRLRLRPQEQYDLVQRRFINAKSNIYLGP